MNDKKILDTQITLIDIDTYKAVGEDHLLILKLIDSNGNGVAGQIVNIGDLGIVITGADGEATFVWKSDTAGVTAFALTYSGKSGSGAEYDYNAAETVEEKFITKKDSKDDDVMQASEPKQVFEHMDFGIDLGTATSYVAKLDGDTTLIVPNNVSNRNYISSSVYIKRNGTILVGDKAKNKIAIDPANGYSEFKLRMGSEYVYEFEATGQKMTPVELSAEILNALKNNVNEMYDYDLKSAVITVPADFNALQVTNTKKAADMAGIEQAILIQEPFAAAIAYGFDHAKDNEIWMVYDFGESTFDVSILKNISGKIINLKNQGDALLGGKLIDFDIVDKILGPDVSDELGLTDFERSNKKYIKQFAKLKTAAETLKKDLSNFTTSEVEIENFIISKDGEMLDFEYEMTRAELDEIMKPYIDRTINHCKKALQDADLSINEIAKIILVGGSTLSPYIHERLDTEFNIPLEYTIDPTTVVARGAAISAGTFPELFKQIEDENFIENTERFQETKETETSHEALDSLSVEIKKIGAFWNHIQSSSFTGDKWNELKKNCEDIMEEIEKRIATTHPHLVTGYNHTKQVYDDAVSAHDETLLATVFDKFRDIYSELYEEEIIIATFMDLAENGEFMDRIAADNLIKEGYKALQNQDISRIKRITVQLLGISVGDGAANNQVLLKKEERTKDNPSYFDVEKFEDSYDDWEELEDNCRNIITQIDIRIGEATSEMISLYNQTKQEYDEALSAHDETLLATVFDKFRNIYSELYEEEIIISTFMDLVENAKFTDRTAAGDLIQEGYMALQHHDITDGLKGILDQLLEMRVPESEDEVIAEDSQSVKIQNEAEDSAYPIHAYQGDGDYVFISYAHLDSEFVLPELKYFNDYGLNIWYDEGITPSTEWQAVIQEKLDKSSLFIVFITPNSVESLNVRNEINYAFGIKKPFIAIHLRNTELKYGLGVTLVSVQAIMKYELDDESYAKKCIDSFRLNGFDVETSEMSPPRNESYEHELKASANNDNSGLNRLIMEIQYFNDLKEYELGIIDREEFDKRRERHYSACR